jgi:hypothetical protein
VGSRGLLKIVLVFDRLLERIPPGTDGSQGYRLPHERIVQSLRRLTEVIPAEADKAQLIFEKCISFMPARRREIFLLTSFENPRIFQRLPIMPNIEQKVRPQFSEDLKRDDNCEKLRE